MKRNRRFSLVELLVVIGVIAMLAALLLPALQKAKETAILIACANNLKQRGVAILSYVNDANGAFPTGYDPHAGMVTQQDSLIDDFLAGNYHAMICPALNDPFGGDWQNRTAALHGGGFGWAGPYYADWLGIAIAHPNWGSGIQHPNWVNQQLRTGASNSGYAVCANQIGKLSSTSSAAVCVEMFPILGGWPGWMGATFIEIGGNPRHGGNSAKPHVGNVLYADGHTRSNLAFKPNEVWNYCTWTDATP